MRCNVRQCINSHDDDDDDNDNDKLRNQDKNNHPKTRGKKRKQHFASSTSRSPQILNPAHDLAPIVRQAGVLEEQAQDVDLHVLLAEDLLGPGLAVEGDLLGGRVAAGDAALVAHEVLHDAVEVGEAVVHGHEVLPGDQAAVVPLAPEGALDGQAGAAQEPEVPPRERVPVDVRQVLVPELHRHGLPQHDGELVVRVRAVAPLGLRVVVLAAEEVREPHVRPLVDPLAQAPLLQRR